MVGGEGRTPSVNRERWFHDARGQLAIVQAPNPPIIVAIAARVLGWLVHGGRPEVLFDAIGFGALFTWAWLELFQGDAYVRRILGAVVLVAIVVGKVR